jgi:hypothetical protein
MLKGLCSWTESKNGMMICATVATVGGLHLLATPPQKVLGILPAFEMDVGGRTVGAQQAVGGLLLLCGVCGIGACCL